MRRTHRRPNGFTLIEMMFAMVILAGGLLAMLLVQTQAMRQGRQGRHTTEAMQIARDQMERFMRLPWDDAAVQPTNWTAPAAVDLGVQNDAGNEIQQSFNVSWRITPSVTDLRVIEVLVTWVEGEMGAVYPRSFQLVSTKNNRVKAAS
jgi:prepilin-type N-terminal cleavage/methylation domain-containing protein